MEAGSERHRNAYVKKPFTSLMFMTKLFIVSASHPKTFKHFRSYAEIVVERRRQIVEGGKIIIHPYSMFSLYWNSVMIMINVAHMVCSSLRLCFILTAEEPGLHCMDSTLFVLYLLCFIDIYVKFNTGYKSNEQYIVVNRRRIIWHYLRTWFIVDLVSCLPMAYIILCTKVHSLRYLLLGHLMPLLRVLRLTTIVDNLKTFMLIFTDSYIWLRVACHILILGFSIHYSNCTIYMLPVLTYYWTGKMPNNYALFLMLKNGDLTSLPATVRYNKALFITVTLLVGVDPSMLKFKATEEFVVYSLIVFYHAMFMVYTVGYHRFQLLREQVLYGIFMEMKAKDPLPMDIRNFFEIANAPSFETFKICSKTYMEHKQLPAELKKRLRQFYRYRYQEQYYKEDDTLHCLSDQLRHEIVLHTCHKLVNRLPLLDGLPAGVVGAVLGCLKPEVYLPNDLVMRAGDIGHCMYFIANGTVAVYSLKGAEICHLEDGDYFGEVALLMRDSKRVATVVSVEITQVYRLDAANFRQIVKSNKVLYDRLQVLASQRMNETVVMDDEFRRHREDNDMMLPPLK